MILSFKMNAFLQELIGHFTVMDGSEGEGDLVLIQTYFALLWKLFLKNTSKHKNNLILHSKAGRFVSKQGHPQPRFHP